ncbi:hypothetical protein [Ralstonia pseudosolanacearum]|uniref:hypothetical protein n=1 Tax=Ralstonia pseudosolanacearum TaxID=1310165 RepID=UPI002676F7FE|nr:hypothetical protein [Ralstonia pseudosolanacearum]MDO3563264.1 hypothetical protein [Ralstonia pseudosolanacearum]MDO3572841.1 hypothetical protein [Ralstonia pseudosolanacearum]MDO3618270.1 hypothetical protein [Ralstonia pseudosolanacearum]
MRDVTDNVTGELPGVEQKRGRGRPRKAHAMTNAERQAAFRARRKAEQPSDRSVTVTKKVAEVDAYDDCQEQVDALRFELAETVQAHNQVVAQLDEARREKDIAWRVMREQRDQAEELGRELLRLKKRLLQEKSVTPSNVNSSSGLFAEIKRSSKYYGQSERGELFAVSLLARGEYVVQGGPGGQYRLKDVWLWAVDAEDSARRVRLG